MRVGIALGSNLGERSELLQWAVGHLRKIHEFGTFRVSTFYETEPQNCPLESPPFLNGVVELESSLKPEQLLQNLQSLESKAGRPVNHERNSPRTLDLDLLYCDGLSLKTPTLELPHPRIRERYFVLAPLAEIRPDLHLPGWERTCREYLLLNMK